MHMSCYLSRANKRIHAFSCKKVQLLPSLGIVIPFTLTLYQRYLVPVAHVEPYLHYNGFIGGSDFQCILAYGRGGLSYN